ncbi:MAG: flagellar hook-basal body complex protein, partial [Caldimicrobium sp.]|nr:flagellar hook-basal body complex protein [Caldimicrobium sp.]
RLQKVGGNLYKETTHSGPPVTGKPGTNGLGTIAPNSIEQSNVDLGEQFVKMIIFQRGFQADARIITVSDTMLEELINLKR